MLILLGLLLALDVIYAIWDIDILNYLCYYITWPMTQFWSWVFGYGNMYEVLGINYLGSMLFGVI
jgi:hypothetical protein